MFMRGYIHFQLLGILSEVLSGQPEGSKRDIEQADLKTYESTQTRMRYTPDIVLRGMLKESISHHLFPITVDGLLSRKNETISAILRSKRVRELYRNEIIRQAQKTADFLLFYEYLASKGLHPVVMKGIICRSLYPQPEHRSSVDEDLLIDPSEFDSIHKAILAYGLEPVSTEDEIRTAWEVSYESREKHLYIEIHKMPFAPDAKAYACLNNCFEGAKERSIAMEIYATSVRTMAPTDHIMYLVCHAYKHFLHGGVGIRQVCDLCMMAEKWDEGIDWETVRDKCEKVRIAKFAAGLFRIGERYLECQMPPVFKDIAVDPDPLLRDILSGGLYGVEDLDRAHSALMTLDAVAADRAGRKKRAVAGSVFLPLKSMSKKYPYLRKLPFLLPVAWVQRVVGYISEQKRTKSVDPSRTVQIGRRRIDLLREYDIIR